MHLLVHTFVILTNKGPVVQVEDEPRGVCDAGGFEVKHEAKIALPVLRPLFKQSGFRKDVFLRILVFSFSYCCLCVSNVLSAYDIKLYTQLITVYMYVSLYMCAGAHLCVVCLYVYVHICTHVHTVQVCAHGVHVWLSVPTCTHVQLCVHLHTWMCMQVCMCVCICVYMRAYMCSTYGCICLCLCACMHDHMCTSAHIRACTREDVCARVQVWMCAFMSICEHICAGLCGYVWMGMYMCAYVHVCVQMCAGVRGANVVNVRCLPPLFSIALHLIFLDFFFLFLG